MGYSSLTYEEYQENLDYWLGTKNIRLPQYATEVYSHGGRGVSAYDFYEDIFNGDLEPQRMPEDYRSGEYGAIALEICPSSSPKRKWVAHRKTITQDLSELFELIDESDNFCMMSAISYCGRQRKLDNARYLYAMVIEIDGIDGKTGIKELFYSWVRPVATMPKPTYVVCSGTGVHLYFVFEKPIPLWKNVYEQLNKARMELIPGYWSTYVSNVPIQYESIAQGFRIVGTRAKQKNVYAMAFQVGGKVTIEYMNRFITNEDNKILNYYKSSMSLEEAKERYPKWYMRRIVNNQGKNCWSRYPGIYYDWVNKIARGAHVGHRYNCMEALCALAVQCNIPPEQVEKDCRQLMKIFEAMTNDEKNHFTEHDVICAMRTYEEASIKAYERNIDIVSKKTGIPLLRAKRNGRKQAQHLKLARFARDMNYESPNDWMKNNGRKSKKSIVAIWQMEHPTGRKSQCIKETGLSKPTVYKWWDSSKQKK